MLETVGSAIPLPTPFLCPRFLKVVLDCIDSECELQGLATPKRKEPVSLDDGASGEKFLEFYLPHIKAALEQMRDARPQQALTDAEKVGMTLPVLMPPVVSCQEAVVVERPPAADLPVAEEFSLDDWMRSRNGTSGGH